MTERCEIWDGQIVPGVQCQSGQLICVIVCLCSNCLCQIDCVYVCKTNSISSYLQTTEPTPPRRPTVSATTAKSAGAPPRSPAPVSTEDRSVTRWGRRFVRRPRRAKSDCPATRVSLVRKTDEVLVNVGKMLWHDEVLHQKETHTPVPKATTAGKVTSRPKKQIN